MLVLMFHNWICIPVCSGISNLFFIVEILQLEVQLNGHQALFPVLILFFIDVDV